MHLMTSTRHKNASCAQARAPSVYAFRLVLLLLHLREFGAVKEHIYFMGRLAEIIPPRAGVEPGQVKWGETCTWAPLRII